MIISRVIRRNIMKDYGSVIPVTSEMDYIIDRIWDFEHGVPKQILKSTFRACFQNIGSFLLCNLYTIRKISLRSIFLCKNFFLISLELVKL